MSSHRRITGMCEILLPEDASETKDFASQIMALLSRLEEEEVDENRALDVEPPEDRLPRKRC